MKQIVDKLNKIALAIDENVEIPTTDLIIDSLDAITKAYGGTPNDSKLIVDKLEAISEVAHGGTTPTGTITITENGEGIDVAQYRYADVSVSGGDDAILLHIVDGYLDKTWQEVTDLLTDNKILVISSADLTVPTVIANTYDDGHGGYEVRVYTDLQGSYEAILYAESADDYPYLD